MYITNFFEIVRPKHLILGIAFTIILTSTGAYLLDQHYLIPTLQNELKDRLPELDKIFLDKINNNTNNSLKPIYSNITNSIPYILDRAHVGIQNCVDHNHMNIFQRLSLIIYGNYSVLQPCIENAYKDSILEVFCKDLFCRSTVNMYYMAKLLIR